MGTPYYEYGPHWTLAHIVVAFMLYMGIVIGTISNLADVLIFIMGVGLFHGWFSTISYCLNYKRLEESL